MEDRELRVKLAGWAGFKEADIKKRYYFSVDGERYAKWYEPDSEYPFKLPRFTRSLDACFEWLVPKLDTVTIEKTPYYEGFLATAEIEERSWEVEDKTPALALCKAIEKLIDNEPTPTS